MSAIKHDMKIKIDPKNLKPHKLLSNREKRLLAAFRGGEKMTIAELGDIAFKRERPAAKRNSWTRNNLRYLVASKRVKKIGRGTYKRVS